MSFSASAVDGLFIILSGAVVVDEELESDGVPVDGVLELELDDDDGGVLGLDDVALDDDDGDGVDFVAGLIDDEEDVDGDGVTTGGVVEVVLVSRWQPASPSARPVQSSVTTATLIVISRSG